MSIHVFHIRYICVQNIIFDVLTAVLLLLFITISSVYETFHLTLMYMRKEFPYLAEKTFLQIKNVWLKEE